MHEKRSIEGMIEILSIRTILNYSDITDNEEVYLKDNFEEDEDGFIENNYFEEEKKVIIDEYLEKEEHVLIELSDYKKILSFLIFLLRFFWKKINLKTKMVFWLECLFLDLV